MAMSAEKSTNVPLDKALAIAGSGRYTYFVVVSSGLICMCALLTIQAMSVVMPVAGCELQLSDATRGIITSMPFTGMLFSAQIFGFLADTFGRRLVMMYCQLAMLVLIVFWSLAPDTLSLGVIVFANGFILTGILTPIYVFVGEFCELNFRAQALVIMSGISAVSTIYLPSLAWVILPLDVYIPISDQLVFTSWRLYILLLAVPYFLSYVLLFNIPETPKFLLSQGREEETLQVLKKMYSVNTGKSEEEFPVSSLSLDLGDELCCQGGKGNRFFNYLKMLMNQIIILFSRQYIIFTLISCLMLFGITGMCNMSILWFPEWISRIINYPDSNKDFNTTLCSLMGKSNIKRIGSCQLDYNFLSAGILLGASEVIASQAMGLIVHKLNKKLYLAGSAFLTAGMYFSTVFINERYTLMITLFTIIIILFVDFAVIFSIVMELFPTHLRSTAASITLTSSRLSSALGSQLIGILYENYCEAAFYGVSAILGVSGILCILIPTRTRPG